MMQLPRCRECGHYLLGCRFVDGKYRVSCACGAILGVSDTDAGAWGQAFGNGWKRYVGEAD